MTTGRLATVVQHLHQLAAAGHGEDASDGQLLDRFARSKDPRAFEGLVRRHGPMVQGVVQRILGAGSPADRDDVFQATFLVLARKARSIRQQASVGSWLYGVARRLAAHLKCRRARRHAREQSLGAVQQTVEKKTMHVDPVSRASLRELGTILEDEIEKLPACYREALLLFHYEGLSTEAAARRLDCPSGTLKGRLVKARALLQQRLKRRGIALSLTTLAIVCGEQGGRAAVPTSLVQSVVRSGVAFACTPRAGPEVSAQAALLAGRALRSAPLAKGPLVLVVVLTLTLLGLGTALWPRQTPAALRSTDPAAPQSDEVWQPPPKDLQGDLLPGGAVARLGTVRWRHGGVTGFVAFLADGKHLVSAGDDAVFHVWEYPAGKEVRRFGPGTSDPLPPPVRIPRSELPVAMSSDGKIVACHHDTEVRLYEVASGKQVATLLWIADFSHLAFSPDGRHLAVRGMFGTVKIWDWQAQQSQEIAVPHKLIIGDTPSLIYSPNGRLLAMTVNDQYVSTIKLVDTSKSKTDDKQVRTLLIDPPKRIDAVLFAPNSKLLAACDGEGVVYLLEVASGKLVRKFAGDKRGGPVTMAFSKDGSSLMTRSTFRQDMREWDVNTGKEMRTLGPLGKRELPYGDLMPRPALSADGTILAVAGLDHSLHFLDLSSGKEVHGDSCSTMPLTAVGWAADGTGLWALGSGKALLQWDAASRQAVDPVALPVNSSRAALSASGRFLATPPRWDKPGQIIDVATGKQVGQVRPSGSDKVPAPTHMVFSADGALLAVRWEEMQKLELYAVAQDKLLHRLSVTAAIPGMSRGGLTCWPAMVFSPDGHMLAAYSEPAVLSLWDTATGQQRGSLAVAADMPLAALVFSPDGRALALERSDGSVALWELATCKERRIFKPREVPGQAPHPLPVKKFSFFEPQAPPPAGLAFSPRRHLLVHGGSDGVIHVWQVQTGQELATFRGHSGVINAFAFSPDGTTLASASADTTVLTWDVSAALAKPVPQRLLAPAELKARWEALASADAQAAFAAQCELSALPKDAVAFLNQHLQPVAPPDPQRVAKLIAELGDPSFKARQQAQADLVQQEAQVVPLLDQALAAKPPLEVKQRLEKIREQLTGMLLTDEKLRVYRAIEVLEAIATPDARHLLQRLGDGAPGAVATTAARAALKRLPLR
jgi:RNA polymerase sigma factor (sigma-70 family)